MIRTISKIYSDGVDKILVLPQNKTTVSNFKTIGSNESFQNLDN